ncbi:MAG: phosphate ABC transporter ATP-binding protein [Chloroflexi bacterium]|jgi:phosphate transport system ATP-binding protein|nr:phosphate ABC transporter ATP-binding protein [Chloroflexota bacterium]|tara:strand:- start:2 stop:778 length:777 start_codon:yes stop_codon:yes gene_type:complete
MTTENNSLLKVKDISVYYGEFKALENVSMNIEKNQVTALIGPSGCGKSTLLRCFNRMNDLFPNVKIDGQIIYDDIDIYSQSIDPVLIRSKIGMVFQKPNPFPKSIYDNVAFGLKVNGFAGNYDEEIERALIQSALWDEVKDRLDDNAFSLSGGQQQRLCMARALAIRPDVILLDEPTSALDPIATVKIEDLVNVLKKDYTIIIVTHNMQQAARVSDQTAFLLSGENRCGKLIEMDSTEKIFSTPAKKETEDYITGRFS